MPELWYRCFYGFLTRVYFARITLLNPEHLSPRTQSVLYLGLHRNGAVDGFVYHRVLRRPVFLISTQLRRNWLARLFFQGIAVTRTKDEPRPSSLPAVQEPERAGENQAALHQCLEHLRAGGQLFVFPEGTSSLGPRHLPFKSGAAWLILDYLEAGGPPLQVIPVGIHYECPWAFRAKVEVVLGPPISLHLAPGNAAGARPSSGAVSLDSKRAPARLNTSLPGEVAASEESRASGGVPKGTPSRLQQLKELKRRIQTALEAVGTNVSSEEDQSQIQRLAYISTLATPRSYFRSLKALEPSIPAPIRKAAEVLEPQLRSRRLLAHQGVPLVPMSPLWLYALALAIFGPLVVAALLLNLPPMLAGWLAGKKFPDDRNVISLWKIMVGIPLFGLWSIAVIVVLLAERKPLFALAYVLLTWLGMHLYYRVKKLTVAVWNGLRYPSLKPPMLAFRETVLHSLPE